MDGLKRELELAVVTLSGAGTLKDRLCLAYINHLQDLNLELADLPVELEREYALMSSAMHQACALPGESVVRASIRKLSNADAERFASLIVRLFSVLATERLAMRSLPSRRVGTPLAALLSADTGIGAEAVAHR